MRFFNFRKKTGAEKRPATPASTKTLLDRSLRRIAGKVAHVGGWAIDINTRQLYWSDEVCAIHELPPGHWPTLDEGLGLYSEEARTRVEQYLHACESDGTAYQFELPKYTAKGRLIWVRSIGEAVRDEQGDIVGLQGAFQDITAQKQAEFQIRQQAAMLDRAANAMVATDPDWTITYWNPAAAALYGWPEPEAMGRNLHDLLKVSSPQLTDNLLTLHQTGRWQGDIEMTRRDGEVRIINASWSLMRDAMKSPASIFTIDSDVTALRQQQAKQQLAEKFEAIGTLAGGIAHDFNNLLTVVNAYSELLKTDTAVPKPQQQSAAYIHQAAEKMAGLTAQLLGFSQRSVQLIRDVDLNSLVNETENILKGQFGEQISIACTLAPNLPDVQADPEQMKQVLLALAANAFLAMPDGGTLRIATEQCELSNDKLPAHPQARPGRYVVLNVRDTGIGMTPDIMERIFDPFYTTRDIGQGSGLGLSMAMGVMQQSGGWITVESEPAKGSCFSLYCRLTRSKGSE